jgi:hypothetical protein
MTAPPLPLGDPRSAFLRDQLFGPDVPGVAELRAADRLVRSRAPNLAPAGTAGGHDPRGDHLRSLQVSAVRALAGRAGREDRRRASLYAREARGRLHRTRPDRLPRFLPLRALPPVVGPGEPAPPVVATPPSDAPPSSGPSLWSSRATFTKSETTSEFKPEFKPEPADDDAMKLEELAPVDLPGPLVGSPAAWHLARRRPDDAPLASVLHDDGSLEPLASEWSSATGGSRYHPGAFSSVATSAGTSAGTSVGGSAEFHPNAYSSGSESAVFSVGPGEEPVVLGHRESEQLQETLGQRIGGALSNVRTRQELVSEARTWRAGADLVVPLPQQLSEVERRNNFVALENRLEDHVRFARDRAEDRRLYAELFQNLAEELENELRTDPSRAYVAPLWRRMLLTGLSRAGDVTLNVLANMATRGVGDFLFGHTRTRHVLGQIAAGVARQAAHRVLPAWAPQYVGETAVPWLSREALEFALTLPQVHGALGGITDAAVSTAVDAAARTVVGSFPVLGPGFASVLDRYVLRRGGGGAGQVVLGRGHYHRRPVTEALARRGGRGRARAPVVEPPAQGPSVDRVS